MLPILIETIDEDGGSVDLKKIPNWENIERDIIDYLRRQSVEVKELNKGRNYPAYKLSKFEKTIYINIGCFEQEFDISTPERRYLEEDSRRVGEGLPIRYEIEYKFSGNSPIIKHLRTLQRKGINHFNDEKLMMMLKEVIGYIDSLFIGINDSILDVVFMNMAQNIKIKGEN